MSKTIYKYPLNLDKTIVSMHEGSQVLTAQMQGSGITLWCIADTSKPLEKRTFDVFDTGNPLPDTADVSNWVATVQDGGFVWHIFELAIPVGEKDALPPTWANVVAQIIEPKSRILKSKILFVENVRRYFGLTTKAASDYCDGWAEQGLLKKMYGLRCPNCGRIVLSVADLSEAPEIIKCEFCEMEEAERFEFKKSEMGVMEFYEVI